MIYAWDTPGKAGKRLRKYRLFSFGAKIHKIVGGEKEMEIKNACRFACMRFYRESLLFYFVRERVVVPIVIRIGNP